MTVEIVEPKKRSHAKRPRTAEEVMQIMRQFFLDMDKKGTGEESKKLWDIMTGLRGPDSDRDIEKDAITIHIRQAMLGEAASVVGYAAGVFVKPKENDPEKIRRIRDNSSGHFRYHAVDAFIALGLKW